MRTVVATRYVTPLREGGSLPALVEADDDGLYVLKFRGAGQGPKALVAEVVVGELARALGFPVPELVADRARPDDRARRARSRDPGPAARERRAQPRRRLPPGLAAVQPGRGPAAGPGLRRRRRLARRARDERRPHRPEPEPAVVARAALADRPRRGALLPPRGDAGAGARARPLRGDPRARAAPVRRRRSSRPTSGWPAAVTEDALGRAAAAVPTEWLETARAERVRRLPAAAARGAAGVRRGGRGGPWLSRSPTRSCRLVPRPRARRAGQRRRRRLLPAARLPRRADRPRRGARSRRSAATSISTRARRAPGRDRAHRGRRPERGPDRRRSTRPRGSTGSSRRRARSSSRPRCTRASATTRPAASTSSSRGSSADARPVAPAAGRRPRVRIAPPGAARGHGRGRPRPSRRRDAVPAGHRDRRRPGDGVGDARPPLVRAPDPARGARAARRGPRAGARHVVQRRRLDRRRAALVGLRATAAAGWRSTASGSTSGPTSGRRASSRSASTPRPRTAARSRRGSSSPRPVTPRRAPPSRSGRATSTSTATSTTPSTGRRSRAFLGADAARPLAAELDYRDPVDLADPLELAVDRGADGVTVGYCVDDAVRAVARVELSAGA